MQELYDRRRRQREIQVKILVVSALLIALGFPGNFEQVYGEQFNMGLQYAAFGLELAAMLLSSGESWLDIQLINLDKKYLMMYVYVITVGVVSMLVSCDRAKQIITALRLMVTLLFAIWLQEQFDFSHTIELICIAQALFVIATIVFMTLYPDLSVDKGTATATGLKGLYTAKNANATELDFGIVVTAFLIMEKRREHKPLIVWLVLLMVQLVLLVMCEATGALLCLVVFALTVLVSKHIRLPLGWIFLGASLLFLFTALTILPQFEWFFALLGKDASISGRVPLWRQIITVMSEHNTFTGFGHSMFWRDPYAYGLVHAGFRANSGMAQLTSGAHNLLLEMWANTGLIGIACFFAMVLSGLQSCVDLPDEKYRFVAIFIAYITINGLTERCIGTTYTYKDLILFWVIAICCTQAAQTQQQEQARQRHRPQPWNRLPEDGTDAKEEL